MLEAMVDRPGVATIRPIEESPMMPSETIPADPVTATGSGGVSPVRCPLATGPRVDRVFRPRRPADLASAGLNSAQVEGLILKTLIGIGIATGRTIANEVGLPFALLLDELGRLQKHKLVMYTNVADMGDYEYTPTEAGRARAREYMEECAYVGTAPVGYDDYIAGVAAQTITTEHPLEADLRRAFSDLLIADEMLQVLGPAINSGKGMFLYGAPGNGKTSIAERVTRCFGSTIWIPSGPRPRRPTGQALRPLGPRAVDDPLRRVVPADRRRRPMGRDPPADGGGRGRIDDGPAGDPLRPGLADQRSFAPDEVQ